MTRAFLLLLILLSAKAAHPQTKTKETKPKASKVFPGFSEYPNGVIGKFFKENTSSRKPLDQEILVVDIAYFTQKDSMIFPMPPATSQELLLQLQKPLYKGDIMAALGMMSKGDSALFMVPADSFFTLNAQAPMPEQIQKGSFLKFQVSMRDIKTMEEFQQLQAEAQAEMDAQSAEAQQTELILLEEYLKQNNITAKPMASGLYYLEEKAGSGPKAAKGQKVAVHYTGKFLDGKVFDSSVERGQPIEFTLGSGQVIPGWDEGIALMNKGAKATLILPSSIAYGAGSYAIPPYSTLIFTVELVDIKN